MGPTVKVIGNFSKNVFLIDLDVVHSWFCYFEQHAVNVIVMTQPYIGKKQESSTVAGR